jgi:hypothetical protein
VNNEPCRLCGGELGPAFDGRLLGRHAVRYFECRACGSLQTEVPFWLDEAYAESNLSPLDTGAAQRNLNNLGAVLALARWLGLRRMCDHGGGDGLLVRLLRDRGLDAHVLDRHARPKYAMGFGQPHTDHERPDLVTAFEVLEHFVTPREELRALFDPKPAALLVSTDAWEGQGPDWWYLAPDTGQHVFFFTRRALAELAAREGYGLLRVGGYWLFLRRGAFPRWRERVARTLLSSRLRSLRNAWAVTRDTPGVMLDHDSLAAALRAEDTGGAPR